MNLSLHHRSSIAALSLHSNSEMISAPQTKNQVDQSTMTAHSPSFKLLALLTTMSTTIASAAFSNRELSSFVLPTSRLDPMPPLTTATTPSTALFYKDGADSTPDEQYREGEIFVRSKRKSNKSKRKQQQLLAPSVYVTNTASTTSAASSAAIKKNQKPRSYNLHKQQQRSGNVVGTPATPEELANHVQSIFSDFNGNTDFDFDTEEEDAERLPQFFYESSAKEKDKAVMKQNSIMLDHHPSLVLNANYLPLRMLPLSIWSWQDTVKAVLSGKAVVVDTYPDLFVRAVSLDIPVPSVIALREFAPVGKTKPAFTRRNVFLRDGYRCQYCSNLFRTSDLSLDHVNPRCLGGKLTWENTVTCCKKCNGRKGSLLPTDLHVVGMELKTEPRCPSLYELAAEASRFVPRKVHPTWEPFLGGDK